MYENVLKLQSSTGLLNDIISIFFMHTSLGSKWYKTGPVYHQSTSKNTEVELKTFIIAFDSNFQAQGPPDVEGTHY